MRFFMAGMALLLAAAAPGVTWAQTNQPPIEPPPPILPPPPVTPPASEAQPPPPVPPPPVVPSTQPAPQRQQQPAPPPVISPTVAERRARREANMRLRLRLLGDDLQTLDQRSYTGRYVDAISSIIIGGALIALGAAVDFEEEGSRRLLYFSGAVSAGQGALSLAFVPSMGDDALRFVAMDDSDAHAARRKIRFGERALEHAATTSKTDRLVNALGGMGLGIAYYGIALPIWGLTGTPLDYILIAYAAIVVVQGVIELLTPTPAERMWDVYVETARQHPIGRRRHHPTVTVGEQGPAVQTAF